MPANLSIWTTFNARDRVSPKMKKMGKSVSVFGSTLGAILGAGAITRGLGFLRSQIGSVIDETRRVEDAKAAFTPIMKGAKAAADMVDLINTTAATTPFQFDNIAGAVGQLLPIMNGDGQKAIKTFRMLGDTAGGNAQKLERIIRGYAKASLKGKPDMESLNMISEAGIPILQVLGKNLGKTTTEILKMSSQSKLTNKDLEGAFETMTSKGGIFYKGMAIASETLSGKLSTLSDKINIAKATIGEQLLPVLKPLINDLIKVSESVVAWVSANKGLIGQRIKSVFDGILGVLKVIVPFFIEWGPAILITVSGIAALSLATSVFNGVFAFTTFLINASPLGILTFILKLAIAGFVMLAVKVGGVGNAFKIAGSIITIAFLAPISLALSAISSMINVLSFLPGSVGNTFNAMSKEIDGFNESVKAKINESGNFIQDKLSNKPSAPNKSAVAAQQINFNGQLNVAGAPDGSTVSATTTGAPDIDVNLLGAAI